MLIATNICARRECLKSDTTSDNPYEPKPTNQKLAEGGERQKQGTCAQLFRGHNLSKQLEAELRKQFHNQADTHYNKLKLSFAEWNVSKKKLYFFNLFYPVRLRH